MPRSRPPLKATVRPEVRREVVRLHKATAQRNGTPLSWTVEDLLVLGLTARGVVIAPDLNRVRFRSSRAHALQCGKRGVA
jgi:hypothetical protein